MTYESFHSFIHPEFVLSKVLGLSDLGVSAAALTSQTPKEEANAALKEMGSESGARLVYCTPEKVVASKRLMAKLEKLNQVWRC